MFRSFISLLFILFAAAQPSYGHAEQVISNAITELENRKQLYAAPSTKRFYQENALQSAWNKKQLSNLTAAIKASASHGLNSSDYHFSELSAETLPAAQRDVLATDAYLALAGHLLGGKLHPVSMEPTWTVRGREKDLVSYLKQALSTGNITDSLEALAPQQPRYQLLQDSLGYYLRIAEKGGWETVPNGEMLKPGMRGERVAALRARLTATGDIQEESAEPDLYDDALVAAVKIFQRRANLEPDGVVGPVTLRKLNRTPQDRINQLRVNLERWRWLPEDLGKKHIRVNIADYQLEAHEGEEVTNIHDIVVGRVYRQTPVFSDQMTYMVLNPWWEVPSKLARQDILPKFQKNPATVDELGYQVLNKDGKLVAHSQINWNNYSTSHFPFRLRQKPGPQNALGKVKFMFPNEHNVYLHDTPSRDLFAKTRRDFSSGCIRVKDPVDLIEWLLKGDPDWSRARVEGILENGKETTVNLKQRIPVHLLYWTVVADDETGGVRFIDDIYERDERVFTALNLPPSKR